jgi:transposase-like protein
MEQWMPLIKECQASGMTVKSWCRQHNIKESAYYYWLKKIRREACAKQLPAVQPENQKPVEFAKLQLDTGTAGTGAAIIIHLPSATVEVKEGTSQKTLEAVLLALKALC